MLTVRFHRDSLNRLSSIFATGHANAGNHGEDIVCAAVSAILQAARVGLEVYLRLDVGASQSSGDLSMTIPETSRDEESVKAIVTTAHLSIGQIARQYPAHVSVTESAETG